MKPDFQGSELFLEHYNQEQKNLVKQLIEAQKQQGDDQKLKT